MATFAIVVLFIIGFMLVYEAIESRVGPEFIVMLFLGFVFIAPLLIKIYRIVL